MSEKSNMPQKAKTTAVATKGIKKTRSKTDIIKRMLRRFFTQFGTAILAVAIVAYVFLQLMLNVSTLLDYENATYASIDENAELQAFLFRNEQLVAASAKGTDCMLVEEGEKVRRGENIVVTYSDDNDVAIQKRIGEIDERIAVLEKSNISTGSSTTNISLIDARISEITLDIIRLADSNKFDKILREKEELLILMNRREALIQSNNYLVELSSLKKERQDLLSSLSGARFVSTAPTSGYFYSTVDGYEGAFTMDTLKNLTAESFEALSKSVPNEKTISDSCGKIIVGSTWYIAVSLDKRTAETFTDGKKYPVNFQYSNNLQLNMTLERRITRTDKDVTILIFSSKQMPDGFDYSRSQTVELPLKTHEGLRVSTSAIRVKDGKTGVYVIVGTKVIFKEATVVYSYGSYSICTIPQNPAYPNRKDIAYSSPNRLSMHDAVVTDGRDIYDGMRLN